MRKILSLLTVPALLLAACTSGDDAATGDTNTGATTAPGTGDTTAPSGTTAPAVTGPSPGVTDGAIRIGITYVDLEAIADVVDIEHGDYEFAYQALIDDLNDRGGIHGRLLEPTFAPINPTVTASAEEACTRLTEDVDVFAVLGFFLGDTVLCPLEVHETAVVGGSMTDERIARAKAPWFTWEAGSDLGADTVRTFIDEGLLDRPFAVFGTVNDQQFVDDTVLPLLEEEGLEPVEVGILDAPADDVFANTTATATIARRFESAGAQTVLVAGQGAALPWFTGLETTSYRPRSVTTDLPSALAFARDDVPHDLSVLDGAIAGAQFTGDEEFDEPRMQECLQVIREAGGTVDDPAETAEGEPETWVSAYSACRALALFGAIVEAAGEDLNYGTFQRAGEQLGEFSMPGVPEPYFYGPVPSLDGDAPIFLFDWDAAAGDFVRRA